MPELAISLNGRSVGKSCNATIGERLDFSLGCSDGTITHPRWHISSVATCDGYVMTEKAARSKEATTGDGDTASWCVCSTGQARVTAEAIVSGKKLVANLTVAVSAPKVIDFSATTDDIHIGLVDTDFHPNGALHLTFGGLHGTVRPGIAWSAKLVGSCFTAGSYGFVQLMKINRKKRHQNAPLPGLSHDSDGAWVLDEGEQGVFYGTTEPVNANQDDDKEVPFVTARWPAENTLIVGEDSPATPLFSAMPREDRHRFDEVEVDEHFQTHLMYKPDRADGGPEGIWVSIARLDWHWKAHARFGQTGNGEPAWTFVSKAFEADPVGERGYDLPFWANGRTRIM
jgi:hypothetical protein